MNELLLEYLPILVFFVIAIIMAAVFVLLPIIVVKQKPYAEKNSAYECGVASSSLVTLAIFQEMAPPTCNF